MNWTEDTKRNKTIFTFSRRRKKMKKFLLAMAAALMVAGTAFAGSNSGTLDVGVAYGNISVISKANNQNHSDIGGWGFTVGYYEPLIPFLGIQANGFLVFPGSDGISYTTNGVTVTNTDYNKQVPFVFSGDLMVALNIPITIFYIRAGAGIGYTLYDINYSSEIFAHQFSIPIFVAFGIDLGLFGVKAGCDIQFVFSEQQVQNGNTIDTKYNDKDYINVFPYICASFKF